MPSVVERAPHSSDSKSLQAMFRSFARTNQFHQGFGVPLERFQVWAVCPGKRVKYCLLEFEGLADIEPRLVTLRPPPRKETNAIHRPSRLVLRRHRQPPAALSTVSLILFSVEVIAHA